MNKLITFRATISKLETMADGSLRLRMDTDGLGLDEGALLLSMRNANGTLAFKPGEDDFTESEIPDIPEFKPEFVRDKSPSERLRAVMFVVWKAHYGPGVVGRGSDPPSFEDYRKREMEKLIEGFKERIPE